MTTAVKTMLQGVANKDFREQLEKKKQEELELKKEIERRKHENAGKSRRSEKADSSEVSG